MSDDIVERLKEKIIVDAFERRAIDDVALCDRLIRERLDAADEITRLRKYEELVQYIASDYWELSHDKIRWLYTEYKEKSRKLIEEDCEPWHTLHGVQTKDHF